MMPRIFPSALIALILSLVLIIPASAQSGALAAEDAAQIQSVIKDQIAAFRKDDGQRAYSHAAPSVRQIFPSVSAFMEMVKRGYQPVYRPQSYTFEDIRMGSDGPAQAVRLVGPSNREWIAIYTFQQQPDGSWKISGVYVRPAPGTTT